MSSVPTPTYCHYSDLMYQRYRQIILLCLYLDIRWKHMLNVYAHIPVVDIVLKVKLLML